MILSGQTIRAYSKGDRPLIAPFAERTIEGGLSYGVGPAGYDVRIEFDTKGEIERKVLRPGDFLLASTIERFDMPITVLGEVKDKSTWVRRGLTVQNTVIEPGWRGWLTLELKNIGNDDLVLLRGAAIAQIVFHLIDQAVDLPYEAGKYQDQGRGPRGPR